jgi:elongation factor G
MVIPVGAENTYKGNVDLLTRKVFIWGSDELGAKFEVSDEIPDEVKDRVEEYRTKLIEKISETDDALMEKYLGGVEPSVDELKKALRAAVIAYKLVPIYCGSSLRNKGVQPLLDAVVEYLPSPLDLEAMSGYNPKSNEEESRHSDVTEPFSGLAFKIQIDPHVGKLMYVRIYSGTLKSGSYVLNSTRNSKERIGRLLMMHANSREEIQEAFAGEIVAVVGLKEVRTGDTLTDEDHPIVLEGINFAEPVISMAIEPKTKAKNLPKLPEPQGSQILRTKIEPQAKAKNHQSPS